mgnify:CR=1 FL=1
MADCSCDGPCADHPNCPPALTRTEPKAESIGSNPLSPVPEGLKDEMVEKAAKAPAEKQAAAAKLKEASTVREERKSAIQLWQELGGLTLA